jgi:hypothetical protein
MRPSTEAVAYPEKKRRKNVVKKTVWRAGRNVTLAVGHAGEGAGEELEGALARLFGRVHLAHVKDVEQAAR